MFYVSRLAGRGVQDAALPPSLPLLQQAVQQGGAHKCSMCLGWQEGESRMLHSLLLSLCSNRKSSKVALTRFQALASPLALALGPWSWPFALGPWP